MRKYRPRLLFRDGHVEVIDETERLGQGHELVKVCRK